MIPLLIWAIKEVAEDIAEDEAEKLAGDVKDKIIKAAGLDQAEVLADEEVESLMVGLQISDFHKIRALEASVIAKINDKLKS
jgi:hypothetical protein